MPQNRRSIASISNATIMMVDDEPLNIEITQEFLAEAGFQHFVSTCKPEGALDLLRTSQASLLLLDLSMPEVSGIDILAGMRNDPALAHVPVIVLTAAQDPVSRLQALSGGAMDFLSKPVDPSELVLRIRNTLTATIYRDYIAQHDGLTDLPDHLQYTEQVEALLQGALLSGKAGALIQFDIDSLGIINETLGEDAGDAVLQGVARQLTRHLQAWTGPGPAPVLHRVHGDRFALAVPGLGEEVAATALARSLLQAAEASVRAARSVEVKITCCIGIAMYPDDGETAGELINHARLALRHARTLGRNNIAFYRPKLQEAAVTALRCGADLGGALRNNELQLYYAPRIDAGTHRLAGAQAVARWSRAGDVVLEGEPLLALAAENGLAAELAQWMLGQFLRDALAWQELGLPVPCTGVGITLGQPPTAMLMEFVGRAVHEGLPASRLCFEFHGVGPFLRDCAAIDSLQRLHGSGARISLAGFGTGDCPLESLAAIGPDEVVIPATLTGGAHSPGAAQALMRATLALLASLRITAVAQGMDTQEQAGWLSEMDHVSCQGRRAGSMLSAGRFAQVWLTQ